MHDYLYLLAFLSGCFSTNFNGVAATYSPRRCSIIHSPSIIIKTDFPKKIAQMNKKSWTQLLKKGLTTEQKNMEISTTFPYTVPPFRFLFKYNLVDGAAKILAGVVFGIVGSCLCILLCATNYLICSLTG